MNIFILDQEPKKAAVYQCDVHVRKMTVETAQLLSMAHWATGSIAPYKPTHKNHPCALWARQSLSNYEWLVEHGLELAYEFTRRSNKIHKTQQVIEWLSVNKPNLPNQGLTPFAMAFYGKDPDKHALCRTNDPVESYRRFYKMDKSSFAEWKNGNTPEWWNSIIL